jgi:uncharacterized protein YdhG (YjbR/CyaY superfamily)
MKSTRAGVPATVDQYLGSLPRKQREVLMKLRTTIRAAAPKAEELISYRMPMFKHAGQLVAFAAFAEHVSFFVMSPAVMRAHAKELKGYDTSAGTIRFAPDEPLPASLVRKLVRARIAENEVKRAKKAARKSS